MKLSASLIKKWMDCPLQVKFSEIENRPNRINAKTTYGTCMHDALDYYNKSGDIQGCIARFEKTWKNPELLDATPQWWPKGVTYGSLLQKGKTTLSEYHEKHIWDKRDIIASEHKFKVPIGFHELSGVVDLIEYRANDELAIIDYKSAGKRPYMDDLRLNIQFCADEETEILTMDGWKTYDQVVVGEMVMTVNQGAAVDEWVAEWQPAESINVFDAMDQDMMSIEGKAHSSLTTMNHRWPVKHNVCSKKGWRRENRVVLSEELTGSDRIVCAAPVQNLPIDKTYSDYIVEILGWFWTEGHVIRGGSISFAQSELINPELVKEIEDTLTLWLGEEKETIRNLIEPSWRVSRDADCNRYYLNRSASRLITDHFIDVKRKVISPRFLSGLTFPQLERLFEISMKADGHGHVMPQSEKSRLDSFQILCSLLGYRTALRKRMVGGAGKYAERETWELSIKKNKPDFEPRKKLRTVVKYTGKVWCPTTANGTWLARRNGMTYFTGNTIYYYASLQPEFWLGNGDGYPPMENGEALMQEFMDTPRRVYWYHLMDNKELWAGTRDEDDFGRLYRCIEEIDKAITYDVYVPNISGSTCQWCEYCDICPAMIPPFDEHPELIGKGYK